MAVKSVQMDKADVATKIDHIDELLNRVELETASRQQEADKLVDESREVRKRYLLSKRQIFTSLDESITQVLLEIDALDRTHHGDRRRAAVNRALRLSDTIEQLKASMSDIRASSEPKTRKQPVEPAVIADPKTSTPTKLTQQFSTDQLKDQVLNEVLGSVGRSPVKTATTSSPSISSRSGKAGPKKLGLAEKLKIDSPASESVAGSEQPTRNPVKEEKKNAQDHSAQHPSPSKAGAQNPSPSKATEYAAELLKQKPKLANLKLGSRDLNNNQGNNKQADSLQGSQSSESQSKEEPKPQRAEIPETPRSLLEHNLKQEQQLRAERNQMFEQQAKQRQQAEAKQKHAEDAAAKDAKAAEAETARKLKQMRADIRQVGADLRCRRQTQKVSTCGSSDGGIQGHLRSNLSRFKDEMQQRNSKLQEKHVEIQRSTNEANESFAKLREKHRKEQQEAEKAAEKARLDLEAKLTKQREAESRADAEDYEEMCERKKNLYQSQAEQEARQLRNSEEENRLKAEQQRREAEALKEQADRAAKAEEQNKQWEKAREQIKRRAEQRELEMETQRKEAVERQKKRDAEIEMARKEQRERELKAQAEREKLLEERRAAQEAREAERAAARAAEEEELRKRREDARRQQAAREADLARARAEREQARAKLKEQLNDDAFDSFRSGKGAGFGGGSWNGRFNTGNYSYQGQSRFDGLQGASAKEDEAKWEAFEAKDLSSISLNDVPFPHTNVRYLAGADFKKLAKRWHPDKFQQIWGSKLCNKDKDAIMERVKTTFQAFNEAR